MPVIEENDDCCTVIVTVDASKELLPQLEAHARMGIHRFAEHPGYIGGALHVSSDGTRLVQYLQWTSESAYHECIDHPGWDELPSTEQFMQAVLSGAATVDARIFSVVSSFDSESTPGA